MSAFLIVNVDTQPIPAVNEGVFGTELFIGETLIYHCGWYIMYNAWQERALILLGAVHDYLALAWPGIWCCPYSVFWEGICVCVL